MRNPNDRTTIMTNDGSGELTLPNCSVIECDDGLLKIRPGDKAIIFNMRAPSFIAAKIEKR